MCIYLILTKVPAARYAKRELKDILTISSPKRLQELLAIIRVEPFGIVLLEALASRKPIVATKVGGIPEFVEHGVIGLLVEPDNPSVLSDAMATILQNPILADTLATNGYELVRAHFNWKVAATKYERAFQALVAK